MHNFDATLGCFRDGHSFTVVVNDNFCPLAQDNRGPCGDFKVPPGGLSTRQ